MTFPQRQSHILKQKSGPDDPELQATLQEALSQVAPEDVIAIADELADRRVRLFSNPDSISTALASSSREVFSAVTHTRTNAQILANYFSQNGHGFLDELLAGDSPTPVRVAVFVEKLKTLDTRLALELSSGILHNTSPQDNWLWTRWLWDPTVGTGILPLLAGSVHNLVAENLADGYTRVGAVSALSMKFGQGTGLFTNGLLEDPRRAPFANSAFLACAYSVYLYGTTSWRLSREFNGLLPSLPNMARKLLGLPKVRFEQPEAG